MQLRKEISDKYKWNIDSVKNNEDIERILTHFDHFINKANYYYGNFNKPEVFFNFYYQDMDKTIEIDKLYHYITNMQSIDGTNLEITKLQERIEIILAKYNKVYSFVEPQLSKLSIKYLKELLKDPRAKNIENDIKTLIISKKHKIDEKTSKIISDLNRSFNDSSSTFNIFTDLEMPFDDALDKDNNSHKVCDSTYGQLISSKDRVLRKNAFNSLMKGYGKFNQTLTSLYTKDIKQDVDFAKLYNYTSVLDKILFNYLPESVFKNNIKAVENNIDVLQDYVSLLNRNSNLNDFSYFDLFEDEKINNNISIEEGQQIILAALAPLGEEYINIVKTKLNDKSIDYLPCKNKTSGAYCSNCYDAKTLILMNWLNNYDSVSTLIHEMGHCINAEYFNKHQNYYKAGITIFSAEIASTVNEILLNQYMQRTCKAEEKAYYIREFLNMVRSTIFRQTLFTEFELYAHESIENEQPLTHDDLNKKYYELNKKYYGTTCILPDDLKYEWSRIPHFYNAYYVFCYSTGLLTAISIVQNILKNPEYSKKYIHFLKNGTDKKPIDILKEIDINLTEIEPFNKAFDFIRNQLNEYKLLCK